MRSDKRYLKIINIDLNGFSAFGGHNEEYCIGVLYIKHFTLRFKLGGSSFLTFEALCNIKVTLLIFCH